MQILDKKAGVGSWACMMTMLAGTLRTQEWHLCGDLPMRNPEPTHSLHLPLRFPLMEKRHFPIDSHEDLAAIVRRGGGLYVEVVDSEYSRHPTGPDKH